MTSFRRWMIRGFFLALLLLWAAGWAVSTCYWAEVGYTHGGKGLWGGVYPGAVAFTWARGTPATDDWYGKCDPHSFHLVDSNFWWDRKSSADADSTCSFFRLAEFSYVYDSRSRASAPPEVWHVVSVPFWFLLLVSGVALRWAWRKTRPQPSPATAFPVETTGGHT